MLVAPKAAAVDVHVGSETIGQGYQLINSSGDILKRSRINQFLRLDVLDLSGDKSNSYSFVSSLRFDGDFGITDAESETIEQLQNNQLSVMYAYFDMRNIADSMDLRLGRQLIIDDMDFTMFDGLRFTYHTPWHLGVEVMAGTEVKNAGFLGVISVTQLEVDGDGGDDEQIDERTGIVVGGALTLENLRDHHGKLGYRRIMNTDTDVDAERLYLNYHYRILPQLHVSYAAAYDFVISDVSDIRAEIRSPGIADLLDIELAFWRLVPSFEGSSIFNVFSIEPLNDIDLRFRFHLGKHISTYVGGYLRLFGNDKDEDETVDEGVKDIGAKLGGRAKLGGHGYIGLDASYQTGYGDQTVIDLFAGYGFLDDALKITPRFTAVLFDDAVQERFEANSFGGQLGVSYRIGRMAKFHLLGELNSNRIESMQFRMFGLVDLDFWL